MTPDQMTKASAAVILLCNRFKVTTQQLESDKRFAGGGYHRKEGGSWGQKRPDLNLARQLLMYYCNHIGLSDEVSGCLVNRCRSAVTHARKEFQNRLDTEKGIRELWQWLEGAI